MQLAETAPEVLVLLDAHLLVAKEDDQMLGERPLDLGELLLADRARQIDAIEGGADGGREAGHPDGFIAGDRPIGHVESFHCSLPECCVIAQRQVETNAPWLGRPAGRQIR